MGIVPITHLLTIITVAIHITHMDTTTTRIMITTTMVTTMEGLSAWLGALLCSE